MEPIYRKLPSGQRGFTLLEFLLALFLSSMLVLLVYQVYHQVLEAYWRKDTFASWWMLSESLARQLEARSCEGVRFRGDQPLLLFQEGTLVFLTELSPGSPLLVAYGPWPEDQEHSFYLEVPYTGFRLPDEISQWLAEREGDFYQLPRFELRLFDQEGEAVEKIRPGKVYRLEWRTPDGFVRQIYFRSCPSG